MLLGKFLSYISAWAFFSDGVGGYIDVKTVPQNRSRLYICGFCQRFSESFCSLRLHSHIFEISLIFQTQLNRDYKCIIDVCSFT